MDGWIKLWRDILEDGWYMSLTDKQKLAWIHLLATVNYMPSEYGCKRCGKAFNLPAGATAKTYRTLASMAGVGEQVMRGLLKKATEKGSLRVLHRSHCHTIYVVDNWDIYQGSNSETTLRQLRGNSHVTQEEEGKKGRREEVKTPKPKKQPSAPSQALDLGSDLLRAITRWKPDHRLADLADGKKQDWIANQALHLDKINRLDKVPWSRIARVIEWLPSSDFWAPNIQGAAKLRAQFDRLEAEMRNPRGRRGQQREMLPDHIRPLGEVK